MPDNTNFGDRYEQERAYNRYVRERQGRTTEMDRAEARHLALERIVMSMRIIAPVAIGVLISGLGAWDSSVWIMGALLCLGAPLAAAILSNVARKFLDLWIRGASGMAEQLTLVAMGVGILLYGLSEGAIGVILAGVVTAAAPFVWVLWANSILDHTDYARLMRETYDESDPRVLE